MQPETSGGGAGAAGEVTDPRDPSSRSVDTSPPATTSDHVPSQPAGVATPATGTGQPPQASTLPTPVDIVRGRWERFRPALTFLIFDVLAIVLAIRFASVAPVDFELITAGTLLFTFLLWFLYTDRMELSALDDLPRIVASVAVAGAVAAAAHGLLTREAMTPGDQFYIAALLLLVLLFRFVSYALLRWQRRRGLRNWRTLILGAGEVAAQLGRSMTQDKSYGCELVGFVDNRPALSEDELPAPNLGEADEVLTAVREHHAERLIIAFTRMSEADLVPLIQDCDREDVEIYVVPRLFELRDEAGRSDEIDGVPLHRLHRAPYRAPTWMLKRALDVVVAGSALVVLSPLLAVLAVVNRLVDGPGIIFKQVRIGIDGREFEVLKFRSMRPVDDTESATNWNIKNDDRVSWFGKVLRRSSLDELPQLWNIVRGDMSLVGPRPERPHFVAEFGDRYVRYDARHRVPCGLTGWAQIHGLRGDTSIAERVRYDNYYIQNWSLWLDIKIILRTLTAFMKGSG